MADLPIYIINCYNKDEEIQQANNMLYDWWSVHDEHNQDIGSRRDTGLSNARASGSVNGRFGQTF